MTALDADVLLSQQLLRVAFFKSGHANGLSDNMKEACALAVKQFFKNWCRTSRHMPDSPTPSYMPGGSVDLGECG